MIPSKHAHLHVAVTTHPGMKGKNNEDRYAVSAYYVDAQSRVPSVFAVISDGIGGHRAGEVAAEIVVEKISQFIAQSDASQPLATLQGAISEAAVSVRQQAEVDRTRKGMGATCACAWIIGNRLYIAAVGDSRIYLDRGENFRKLTTDHTWIQEALDQGVLTPEQARGHPNAHVIRRYLGSQHPVEVDFRLKLSREESDQQAQSNQGLQLHPGDIVLLCSDGLTDLVEDHEIQTALRRKRLEDALKDLVNLANERGGHDNITIIAMKMPKTKAVYADKSTLQAKRKNPVPLLLILLSVAGSILALAALAFAGYYFLRPVVTSTPTQTLTAVQTTQVFSAPEVTTTPTVTITALSPRSETPISPPSLKVTITLFPKPSSFAPTYTPWPTNTGIFKITPTANLTPVAP